MLNILLIGCGNMGYPLIKQWMKHTEHSFTIITPQNKQIDTSIISISLNELDKHKKFDVIIIAIKPQLINKVIPSYTNKIKQNGLIVSIAAGFTISKLSIYYPNIAIVRSMPNLTARINESITAINGNKNITHKHIDIIEELFNLVGKTIWLDKEDDIDKLTAVAGSGPGFMFHIFEAYIDAVEKLGLDYTQSKEIVLSVIISSAKLALNSQDTPTQLRQAVTSKNGTTEAGLKQLMHNNQTAKSFESCIESAYNRAKEISNS